VTETVTNAVAEKFGDQTVREAKEIIARYPVPRSALLPMLHLVQSVEGYVSPDGIAFCADQLSLTRAEVGAVATFYTMYKRRPTGEYLVSVCTNTMCGMLGGDEIFAALKDHLGIGSDQTTEDGAITLEHAECLAACDYAPVMTVNYEFFDQATESSALDVVKALQRGEKPAPTRGAPLCGFKQIERLLAGFGDGREDAVAAPSGGEPTLAGVKLAEQRGERAPAYPRQARSTGSAADVESAKATGTTSASQLPGGKEATHTAASEETRSEEKES
jgi:NADH-quinone oxidoreductase subunit E